jgi:acyl carrier protein
MITFESIFQKLSAIVAEKLAIDASTITLESTMQDLGADSLDMVEIVMNIEEHFDIQINDDDAEKLHTMREVTEYIQSKLKV